jgi:uncharacterized membrane protein YgcG
MGNFQVQVPPLSDAHHHLSDRDAQRLRFLVDELERQMPQVAFCVWMGALPDGSRAAEAAFWLINHGAFARRGLTRAGANAVSLVIDPSHREFGIAVGYELEEWLNVNLQRVIQLAQADLANGALAKGCERVLDAMGKCLRSAGKRRPRQDLPPPSPIGLGMPPTTTALQPIAERQPSVAAKVLCLLLSGAMLFAAPTPLPLPQWQQAELDAMRANEGQPMRIGELLALGAEPLDEPVADELSSSDLSRFLPPALIAAPASGAMPRSAPPPEALREIDLEAVHDAMARTPEARCVDPHGLLHETSHEQMERFLAYHAKDALIGLRVLVIGRHEVLPSASALAGLIQLRGTGGYQCWAVMPMGDLSRTRLFLSHGLQGQASADDCAELFAAIDSPHTSATDAADDLRALTVRLSVRLFWMQRHLPPVTPAEVRPAILAPVATVFEEVLPPRSLPIPGLLALGAIVVLGLIGAWRWRRHVLTHHEWILPERPPVQPRLGGMNAGGAMGMAY